MAEESGTLSGFILGRWVAAPPVYDPGGPVCLVDDFIVADGNRWVDLGGSLFRHLEAHARDRGAALTVIVCGAADVQKRALIDGLGASVTSLWCVKPMGPPAA